MNSPISDDELLAKGENEIENAYAQCENPEAIQGITHFLFPATAKTKDETSVSDMDGKTGRLASSDRLEIALKMHISNYDISLINVRNYLLYPEERAEIESSLNMENCLDFINELGNLSDIAKDCDEDHIRSLCLSIARITDKEYFVKPGWFINPVFSVLNAIDGIVKATDKQNGSAIAAFIIDNEQTLTIAISILAVSYLDHSGYNLCIVASQDDREIIVQNFFRRVLDSAKEGTLFKTQNPGFLLSRSARIFPDKCPEIFSVLCQSNSLIDDFVLNILEHSKSSERISYAMNKDITAYCSLDTLREHAKRRLSDDSMTYPVRAAWRVINENKPFRHDGTECSF
jgi:hypothetical protein